MRYSQHKKVEPERLQKSTSNRGFIEEVAKRCSPELCRGGILLVGGRDTRALNIRRAQSALRYDRRASAFSHAALMVTWDAEHPHKSRGLEVTLEPEAGDLQVPERNGVTELELSRYLDVKRYPNLAFITVELTDAEEEQPDGRRKIVRSGADRKADVLAAAADPCRQRDSFPMWDALATWGAYAYSPEASQNPLLRSVPLPAASLIEYAFGAAGVDIVPGASSNHSCPELLWASALHWQEGMSSSVKLAVFSVLRDEHGTPLAPLSMKLGPY
jgi:hypothetical protein